MTWVCVGLLFALSASVAANVRLGHLLARHRRREVRQWHHLLELRRRLAEAVPDDEGGGDDDGIVPIARLPFMEEPCSTRSCPPTARWSSPTNRPS